jgi:hypothetical protein
VRREEVNGSGGGLRQEEGAAGTQEERGGGGRGWGQRGGGRRGRLGHRKSGEGEGEAGGSGIVRGRRAGSQCLGFSPTSASQGGRGQLKRESPPPLISLTFEM